MRRLSYRLAEFKRGKDRGQRKKRMTLLGSTKTGKAVRGAALLGLGIGARALASRNKKSNISAAAGYKAPRPDIQRPSPAAQAQRQQVANDTSGGLERMKKRRENSRRVQNRREALRIQKVTGEKYDLPKDVKNPYRKRELKDLYISRSGGRKRTGRK